MKLFKIFGFSALAALMAMASVGASSAMASSTQLCKTDPGAGACSSPVTHVHEATTGVPGSGELDVECNVLFLSTSVGGLGAPQVIEGNFTYTKCTEKCTVEEINGPSVLEVLRIGHETASVTYEFELHVNCSFINCYYNGEGQVGTAKGPLLSVEANGEISILEQELNKVKGIFCPSEFFLYLVTTPLSATYIGS